MNKLFTKIAGVALGLTLAIGVGVAIGNDRESTPVQAAANTVSWSATSGALGGTISSVGGTKTGSITLSGGGSSYSMSYTRTLKSGADNVGWSSNCIQLGKNGGVENVEFTTSAIPGTISSVSIECASYQGKHNVSIKVGSDDYLKSTGTSSWTTVAAKSGTGTSSGTVTISLTNGTRALYVKSISVTYEESSSVSVTGLEVLDDNANELSDGDEINLDAASTMSISTDILCGVTYDDSQSDGDVDISTNQLSGFDYSTEDNETYTLTFSANGDYDVTVAAHKDNSYSITVTYHISGIPTFEYELYTGSIASGDYVIMSADNDYTYVLGNSISSNRIANGTAPAVVNNKIVNPSAAYVWHIAKNGEYWTIQNADSNKYLAGTSTKNQGALLDDYSSNFALWSISNSSEWVFHNFGRSQASTDTGNAYLRNNTTSGWACYTSSYGTAPALFKLPTSEKAIEVEVTGETTLGVGETAILTATKLNGATGTVGWKTSDDSILSISASTGDSITVTAESAGPATITASLTDCEDVETSFTVRNGTSSSPYTVAEARAAIDGSDSAAKTGVYTSGIISQVDSLNSDNSITYWISEDGETTSSQLEIYKGFGLNSATFSSKDDLQVGDVVTIYGNLTKYNSTYEYSSGSHLTSYNRPDVELVSISSISGSLESASGAEEWDLSGLTVNGVLSNSSATVNVTRYVELSTEDVPGTVSETTVRNVSVTATGIDDSSITLTQDVSGTIKVVSGDLGAGGRFFIFTENGALENRNYSNATSDKVDITTTSAWIFTLVNDDTYTISNGSEYLYASNANTGLRTSSTANEWVLTALTGDDDGLYQLVTSDGTNDRYLCDYKDSKDDWRTYKESSIGEMYKLSIVEEKEVFANNFKNSFTAGCNASGGYTPAEMDWTSANTQFATLSEENQAAFTNAEYTKTGSGSQTVVVAAEGTLQVVAEAVAKYDVIVTKYNTSSSEVFDEFMGRVDAGMIEYNSRIALNSILESGSGTTLIIIVVSLIGAAAMGGYFLFKKKKQ